MKWGRRKKNQTSPSSSPSSSIISRVLPISWFSKLRRNFETAPAKNRHEAQFDFFPTPCPNLKRERFYSMDVDDPFWRLSFSEEKIPARRSTGGIMGPVWPDFDWDLRFPVSRLEGETVRWKREECRNFNDMVRHVKRRKEREKLRQRMKDGVFVCDHQSSRKFRREKRSESGKDAFPAEPPEYVPAEVSSSAVSKSRKQSKNQILRLDQGCAENSEEISSVSEWRLLDKNGSFSLGMRVGPKQKGKAKASSPRTECKIRSLEEMKRARSRSKTKKEEGKMEGKTVFNSFAVMKNSLDPQRDFRNSMVEMIREKGIFRQEDLEELLASYLALNSDECHGIIIEVFQKVWFELRGTRCFDY